MTFTLYKIRDRPEPGAVLEYWSLLPPQNSDEKLLRKVVVEKLPKKEGVNKISGKNEWITQTDIDMLEEEAESKRSAKEIRTLHPADKNLLSLIKKGSKKVR